MGSSAMSLPSHLGKGWRSCSRSLPGGTCTLTLSGSSAGASYPSSPRAKPWGGRCSPSGRVRRAGRERGRGGAAVVAPREVPVERADDRVGLGRRHVRALPLADAGPAGVGQDRTPDLLEGANEPVAPDGLVDPLGARGDEEGGLCPEARLEPLHGAGGGPVD